MKALKTVTLQMNMNTAGGNVDQTFRDLSGVGPIFTFGRPKLGALLTSGRSAIIWPGVETVSQAYFVGKETPDVSGAMPNIIPIAAWVSVLSGSAFYSSAAGVTAKKWLQVPFTVSALDTSYVWTDDVTGAGVTAALTASVRAALGVNLNEASAALAAGSGNFDALFSDAFTVVDSLRQGKGFNMPETPGACSFAVGFDQRNFPVPYVSSAFQLAITFASLS